MQDLEVEISSDEGGSYMVTARSDAAGDTPALLARFPFDEQGLARQLQAVELALAWSASTVRRQAPPDERPVQEFGTQLFEFAFPAEVRENLNAVRRQAAQDNTHVQVRLRARAAELAALPWEFLYDPGRDEYLCLSTPLVRYLDVLEPRRPLVVPAPLRILGMVARPGDRDQLNVEHEKRRLAQALAELEGAGGMELTWAGGQTWWDLQAALDQGDWHILHFIGHGRFDQHTGEGVLALADEDGGEHRLAATDLGLLLAEHRSLRLVVLNSCETARASTGDVFSSTAAVLMRRGIPAVVAMQYDISDDAAIAFARGLYTAIAARHPVDQAVTRARRAIKLARRNTLEWATPVLYLRSPRANLFDLTTGPAAVAPPPEPVIQPPPQREDEPTSGDLAPPRPDSAASGAAAEIPPSALRVPTGSPLARLRHKGEVRVVAFSPDGTRLATASRDNKARLWDLASGKAAQLRHDCHTVQAVAFSPDGTRLATVGGDMVLLWDVATGKEAARLRKDNVLVEAVLFSPDGTRLAAAGGHTVLLWDVATGGETAKLRHDHMVEAVAFSPDGTLLATAAGITDGTARLCEVATGREVAQLRPGGRVYRMAFSPDGTQLATSTGGIVLLWDVATGKEAARLRHGGPVFALAFSPDGTRLATVGGDGTARLWDVATGSAVAQLQHGGVMRAVAFSPDGTRLATASDDKTARLWDVATGQEAAKLQHDGPVFALAFSPDGTRLATGSDDKTARLWAA